METVKEIPIKEKGKKILHETTETMNKAYKRSIGIKMKIRTSQQS